jgi:hypothetical protein
MARGTSRQASTSHDDDDLVSLVGTEKAARYHRTNEYFLALGKFVDAFSTAETFTHYALQRYAKTPEPVTRAVFSGTRIDVEIQFLRRLRDTAVINDDEWNRLEPILEQLRTINGRRNEILHYGARAIASGEGFVTNLVRAHTRDRVTSFPISPRILKDMTDDLRVITILLATNHTGIPTPPETRASIETALPLAWRYKSPQQSQNRCRPSNRNPKRRDQHEPSPE